MAAVAPTYRPGLGICGRICKGCQTCFEALAYSAWVPRIESLPRPAFNFRPDPGFPPFPSTSYPAPFDHLSWPPRGNVSPNASSRHDGTPLWVAGTFPPVPYGIAVPVQLHPLLISNPNNPAIPPLQWDIRQRPHTATRLTGRELFVRPDLNEPATAQKVDNILIYSTTHNLASWMVYWGGINVKKSNGKAVTIYDVMDAIHQFFQTPLTSQDMDRAYTVDPSCVTRFNDAAYWRIRSSTQFPGVEIAEGLKRADVLGDYHYFQGLRPFWHDGFWIVYLELLGRPKQRTPDL